MVVNPDTTYPKQMNGPVISAFGSSVKNEFSNAENIAQYLYSLTIDTAQETELDNIGRIIGYLRPIVPEGFNQENVMLLGTLPIEIDEQIGLAQYGYKFGGTLSTLQTSDSNFMELSTYRLFLKDIAVLKRYGITLNSVDKVVSEIDKNYTISFDENNDIKVHFAKNIGYKNIWILTQLFYRIATEPQVLITSGT